MAKLGSENFSEPVFNNFCKYIYANCGIVVREDKKVHLGNRLRKRIKELNLTGYEEYWNYLSNNSRRLEENFYLFEAVAINETYFQRGTSHYKILIDRILPQFYADQRFEIKIWSCGTSTGEEAYDLAMLSIEFEKEHPEAKIIIIGTDISKRVLDFARKGEYADRRIGKLTEIQVRTYFEEIPADTSSLAYAKKVLSVKSCLKDKVVFQYQNMISDAYLSDVDIIFCRNVMIYFDKPTQSNIIEKFYNSLKPGGFLFLGHSEALQLTPKNFTMHHFPEGTIYKKEL